MANRYTVYNTDTSTVEATGRPWPTADGVSDPVGMPANLVLLLEVTEAKPTIDSMTHKHVEDAINYDTINKTATRSWSSVALTAEEIAERTPAHVEINGIKWKTDEASQAAFSSMTLLLDKAGMASDEMVMIKDCFGNSHAMTVSQYSADVLNYGMACYTNFHS
jgi:hypothetical protein